MSRSLSLVGRGRPLSSHLVDVAVFDGYYGPSRVHVYGRMHWATARRAAVDLLTWAGLERSDLSGFMSPEVIVGTGTAHPYARTMYGPGGFRAFDLLLDELPAHVVDNLRGGLFLGYPAVWL